MLICEELFLLLTKDSGKPESRMTYPVYGLTGALLTDLLLAGRISLTEERSPRIYIINSGPTGHPVLDWALTVLPAKDGKRFSSVVSWGKLNPTRHIAASLETTGVIRIHTGGLFGSFSPTYPTLDPVPERLLRERIDGALRGVQPPTGPDVALLAILQALNIAPVVLPQQETGLSRGELKHRIKEISGASPVGRAVQRAVDATTMAIIAATSAVAVSTNCSGPPHRRDPPSWPTGHRRPAPSWQHTKPHHPQPRARSSSSCSTSDNGSAPSSPAAKAIPARTAPRTSRAPA